MSGSVSGVITGSTLAGRICGQRLWADLPLCGELEGELRLAHMPYGLVIPPKCESRMDLGVDRLCCRTALFVCGPYACGVRDKVFVELPDSRSDELADLADLLKLHV